MLARVFLGPGAARFLGVAAVLGLVAVAVVTRGYGTPPLTAASRCAWPLALVLAMELGTGTAFTAGGTGRDRERDRSRDDGGAEAAVRDERHRAPAGAVASSGRDGLSEILRDLRSPLTALRLYAELVADRVRKGEPVLPEHVGNLGAEIDLIQSMLEMQGDTARAARVRPRRPERFDLVKVLGTLASSYRLLHSERLRIEFIAESPELVVAADPVAVQRSLRNLLDNARHMRARGGGASGRPRAARPSWCSATRGWA